MIYPLVHELAAIAARVRVPVAVTCRVLGLSRQPHYRWLTTPVTTCELEQAYRANARHDGHRDDPEFGYRYLATEATEATEATGAGEPVAERTAWALCSAMSWWSAVAKVRRGKPGRPGPAGAR